MKKTITLFILSFCIATLILAGRQQAAHAQNALGDWTEPVNLSRSGGSSNPRIVVDSNNFLHVVWQDLYAGYVYTVWDGAAWSPPEAISFPFDEYLPVLISDGPDRVHAFWIEEDAQLRYSRVNAGNFGSSGNWTGTQILARSATNVAIITDSQDNLHLFYVRPEDTLSAPAGVYVRTSDDGGVSWSVAAPVYLSPYMRVLIQEDANLSLWTTEQEGQSVIYAAWDNRPLKRIFITSSADGGASWQEPVSLIIPSSTSSSVFPFGVELGGTPEKLLAVWNLGFPGGNCDQYYQWSFDNGLTWSEPQQMLTDLIIFGCPTDNLIIRNDDGEQFLLTTFQDQVYIQAWDGNRWSATGAQNPLFNFNDPETLNSVVFRCRQYAVLSGSQLFAVGCDSPTGGITGGDIWSLSLNLGSTADWFPSASAWKDPVVIQSGSLNRQAPLALMDQGGRLHILWSQPESVTSDGEPSDDNSIFYARLDNGGWSDAALVLRANSNHAGFPSVIVDQNNRFHLVFVDEFTGELYYSWATVDRAINSSEWAEKDLLYSQYPVGSHPAILADEAGTLYIFFAVPINEGRGIYYLKSLDGGGTWSDPVQIFDAALAGWEAVERVRAAATAEGSLHLLFYRKAVIQTNQPPNLYFTQSGDGGLSWTVPDLVVERITSQAEILGIGDRVIHRIWHEEDTTESIFAHEYSLDNGLTWIREPNLISGDVRGSVSQVIADRNERVHLLELGADLAGNMRLNHRIWENDRWISIDELDLNLEPIQRANSLNGMIAQDGRLAAVFNTLVQDFQGEQTERFYYSETTIELSGEPPTPLPPLPPTPVATENLEAAVVITPTPTLPPIIGTNPGPPVSAFSQWIGAIIGAVVSGLIVIAVLLFGWRRRSSRN